MSIYWSEGRSYFAPNAGLGVRTGRNEEPCLVRVGSDFLSRSEPSRAAQPALYQPLLFQFARSRPGERSAQGNRSEN